jgi:protein TonB
MPGTAKDTLSESSTTAGLGKNEVQKSQPGNAAGTEIPVTVHASRYSAASKGSGKLPPVHEETRTVIVLPQGAVVRLSATVTVGELVVLTNKRTGADVICRVTSVKAQPGIQNYVHLEFTQRAVDFWEESSPAERGNSIGKPAAVAALPTAVPSAPTPIALGHRTPSSPVQESQPAPKISVSGVEIKSAPAPLPKITPLADVPAGDSEDPVEALAAELQGSEITLPSASAKKQSPDFPRQAPRFQPFEPVIPQSKKTSKTIILFAIAAVVLLAIGVVGGSVLLRQDRGTIVAPVVLNPPHPPSPSVASESEAPIVETSGKTNSLEPPASTPAKNSVAETPPAQLAPIRPPIEAAKAVVQPQPVSRPNVGVGRISAPKLKAAPQLNSTEPPPVLPPDPNALSATGESSSNTAVRANALPLAEPARPVPGKGGELQQPKLLSSVAAVYPPIAVAQHVQGDVTIDALIDATGKVSATSVLSGNPLLQKAAIESLRLWKYQPALLNGEPIPIHIKVTITFHRG